MCMAISSFSSTSGVSSLVSSPARFELSKLKHCNHGVAGLGRPFCLNCEQQLARPVKLSLRVSHNQRLTPKAGVRPASVVCSAALNARCGAEGQTQTVEKPVSVISHAPGKEKSPQLDDGGTGFPPRDDDGGGGGGGGGGGNWRGGFFFFGFLAFLGFLKDKENEGPYQDSRRR
ncbi:hypothetical protein BVRB_2g034200 [Beta vulgaris subsp. vulgaris]|nr:hypothetical protein BVRB_2g034200 [Beta vulgaris subsp. vulgaris]